MALATLAVGFDRSDISGFFIWSQAHAGHHTNCIVAATSQKFGSNFSNYILDPFDPTDPVGLERWLTNHQIMHQAMDIALSLPLNDLSELDWNDEDSVYTWFTQNFSEHQAWGTKLGVS
jgi:hypothetical protein